MRKHTHDVPEVLDGTPSMHDAKAVNRPREAAGDQAGESLGGPESDERRDMRAWGDQRRLVAPVSCNAKTGLSDPAVRAPTGQYTNLESLGDASTLRQRPPRIAAPRSFCLRATRYAGEEEAYEA